MKRVGLSDKDIEQTVTRYLTFSKFVSMLSYQALWFSKLKVLQDQYEGALTSLTETAMSKQNAKWKKSFDPSYHNQIDNWPSDNVNNGRGLTLVNCWFLGSFESKVMWDNYAGCNEGVAVRSTIRKLTQNIFTEEERSFIGLVKYVDFKNYQMDTYKAHQAHERAFIKDISYSHEREVRVSTMSIKTPRCVNMEGLPYTPADCSGKNMNNFENPGLYVGINFQRLIDHVILAPGAPVWFEKLIRRIFEMSKLQIRIQRSSLEANNG